MLNETDNNANAQGPAGGNETGGGFRSDYLIMRNAQLEGELMEARIRCATFEEIVESLQGKIDAQSDLLKGYEQTLGEIKSMLHVVKDSTESQREYLRRALVDVIEPALTMLRTETQVLLSDLIKSEAQGTKDAVINQFDRIFGGAYGSDFRNKLEMMDMRITNALVTVEAVRKQQKLDSATISDVNARVHRGDRG